MPQTFNNVFRGGNDCFVPISAPHNAIFFKNLSQNKNYLQPIVFYRI